jgi:hypothetical protein
VLENVMRMFAWTSRKTAQEFAAHNFAGCSVHQAEAISVHEALQRLCKMELSGLDLAKLVGDVVPAPNTLPRSPSYSNSCVDSLERIEVAMAVEEEQGSLSDQEMEDLMKDLSKTEYVFNALLGSVVTVSTWNRSTIWVRSIRTIVNERVRHHGGCTCE